MNDPDVYAFLVMNSLMGGGSSFSAGGPGKGMYTQLYCDVLSRYYWTYSAQSHCFCYSDSGLFTLTGSAAPQDVSLVYLSMYVQYNLLCTVSGLVYTSG